MICETSFAGRVYLQPFLKENQTGLSREKKIEVPAFFRKNEGSFLEEKPNVFNKKVLSRVRIEEKSKQQN